MVKKLSIPCDFGGKQFNIDFYIGNSATDSHPIHFQMGWLSKEKGGSVPKEVLKSLEDLKKIADQNNVDFAELCSHVMKEVKEIKSLNSIISKNNLELSKLAKKDNQEVDSDDKK